jgi:EAL domain-containing protein (putative c-di-GMP-specific phosphodiesterase class I)
VKLDMGLVRGLDADPVRREIVAAVAGLCARIGVGVVAEGVETAGELRALREAGVHLVQGWLIGRPVTGGLVPDGAVRGALEAAGAASTPPG